MGYYGNDNEFWATIVIIIIVGTTVPMIMTIGSYEIDNSYTELSFSYSGGHEVELGYWKDGYDNIIFIDDIPMMMHMPGSWHYETLPNDYKFYDDDWSMNRHVFIDDTDVGDFDDEMDYPLSITFHNYDVIITVMKSIHE